MPSSLNFPGGVELIVVNEPNDPPTSEEKNEKKTQSREQQQCAEYDIEGHLIAFLFLA